MAMPMQMMAARSRDTGTKIGHAPFRPRPCASCAQEYRSWEDSRVGAAMTRVSAIETIAIATAILPRGTGTVVPGISRDPAIFLLEGPGPAGRRRGPGPRRGAARARAA